MRVFLSWSGVESRGMARALRDVCSLALRPVEFWASDEDLRPGADWWVEITSRFSKAEVAVLCLTRSNLSSPWIHFEAGLVAHHLGQGRVIPYLLDFSEAQLKEPLSRFQAIRADRDGTFKLFRAINEIFELPKFAPQDLEKQFGVFWPSLEAGFKQAVADQPLTPPLRTDTDLLEEILKHVRASASRPGRGTRRRGPAAEPTAETVGRFSEAQLRDYFDRLYSECQESIRDAWDSSPDQYSENHLREPLELGQDFSSAVQATMRPRIEELGVLSQWQRWWTKRFGG